MALPIQNAAVYTTTVPSTKQEIKFRAFLVKEEKLLLMVHLVVQAVLHFMKKVYFLNLQQLLLQLQQVHQR